jgi:hypothetical protein
MDVLLRGALVLAFWQYSIADSLGEQWRSLATPHGTNRIDSAPTQISHWKGKKRQEASEEKKRERERPHQLFLPTRPTSIGTLLTDRYSFQTRDNSINLPVRRKSLFGKGGVAYSCAISRPPTLE